MPVGQLRLMATSDLNDACRLSAVAGWNQTREDWQLLLRLSPRGCFAIELDGAVVATTTVLCYQRELAWIGMVLTEPEHRGRGIARRLLTHALEYAEYVGVATVKLDATEQGRPIYEKLGFTAEQPVERWARAGSEELFDFKSGSPLVSSWMELDREAFGADRSGLLHALGQYGAISPAAGGFLFRRAGHRAHYLGPCVARESETARRMIIEAMSERAGATWFWDLLPANKEAVALAIDLGFRPQRFLTRMARGKGLRGRETMIYAIAGLELG